MTTSLSVFGLGYVGCVTSACFAKEGNDVIGVDVSATKVDMINSGSPTIVEAGIAELVGDMVRAGRLCATSDPCDAVLRSEISLVCVGTPSLPNGGIDLKYVARVCESIGHALRRKDRWHTIVVRSTVLPGSTASLVIPALEASSGKKAGRDFGVAMNPEFLREGSSIRDFYEPPFTLIGTEDERTAQALTELYAGIDAPLHVTTTGVAEMIKYSCNCFHGLKVGFANEIGNVCKAFGIDSHEVMRLFCMDTKLNLSPVYLRPGFAFGGSCLPKDLRAITQHARSVDVPTPILSAVLESNQRQIDRAYDMVRATGSKRVGVLGLAFKAGTDDLRESPMVSVVERLIGKGFTLAIYDRDVSEARLIGSNREYIEKEIPHIWSLMRGTIEEVVDSSDVLVIGNGSGEFRRIEPLLKDGQVVVDLVRAFGTKTSSDGYAGICW